jgi:serine/threonine-protein kinase RsbW
VADLATLAGGAPTVVSVAAGPLVEPIFRRVVGAVAARADLPVDRLEDAVLVADALAARAGAHASDGRATFALHPGRRSLDLRIGPLLAGGGRELIASAALPGLGNVVERLADEVAVEADGAGEFLRVVLRYEV